MGNRLLAIIAVDGFEEDLGGDAEGVAVDMGEVVVDGVPMREETHATAVLNDVDHGDVGKSVDIVMVIENGVGVGVLKNLVVAEGSGGSPHLVENAASILSADFLFGEAGLLGSYHVEEHAVDGGIIGCVRIETPILGAFAPTVLNIVVGPLWTALVFDIEKDEVDRDTRTLAGHDAGHLHEHSDTAGSVVGSKDGFAVIVLILVVVGP